MLSFFLLRVMDLTTRISEGAMKLMFELNGWNLTEPFIHNDVAYVKPGLLSRFFYYWDK